MKKLLAVAATFLALSQSVVVKAGDDDSTKLAMEQFTQFLKLKDSLTSVLKYQDGIISLPASVIQLNVPKEFKYLGKEQSKYVLESLWGNLPQDNLQGMLFPVDSDPFDDSSYAYIITYSPVGYIKDADAKDINYTDLMKQMQEDEKAENTQRMTMGLSGMHTVGWAAQPYYDDQKKVLYWALELKVDNTEENTLNYKIISLGRKGMLAMNAVAGMNQMDKVKADAGKVLNMAEFTAGNRYADFDSKVDDVAAWTVGGLVAGKILAKTVAGAGILKFLKFIIIGVIALGGAIWRFITGRKKKEEEFVYEPSPAPVQNQPGEEPKL
jgi:uncharacterized membrane-anchored protein